MFKISLFLMAKNRKTQMYINWHTDKQIVVHSYDGILFAYKKGMKY